MAERNTSRERALGGLTDEDDLRPLAEEVLTYCDEATAVAEEALQHHLGPRASALANVNSFNDAAVRTLSEISEQERRNLEAVLERPAVARLVTVNHAGQEEVIYITPSGAPRASFGNARVASYRSEVGHLAAQPIGAEVELGDDRFVVLRSKTTFLPERFRGEWDAEGSRVESSTRTPRTIVSLRALLRELAPEDALRLLDEALDQHSPIVFEGFRRSVVQRMSLREQPLLDQYQDAIFRRPLNSQILILGPPGSGKTTTLIKRLGMKVDAEALTEDEKALVARSAAGPAGHGTSWLMFSPSELLRQYVKEAFARERVPASDRQMMVWDRFRDGIARTDLNILRSGSSAGAQFRPGLNNLLPETVVRQTVWYDDFIAWQEERFWTELSQVATALDENRGPTRPELIGQLIDLVQRSAKAPSSAAFAAFKRFERDVREVATNVLEAVNTDLRKAFAEQLQRDRSLLERLLAFVQTLDDEQDDSDEIDLEGDDDEDDVRDGRASRETGFDVYIRAARAQARAMATGRRVSARSRNGRIIEWMGDRLPSREALVDLGMRARRAGALRRMSNPTRAYLRQLPIRYRAFRRERAAEGVWYADEPYASNDLCPIELDLIVLAVLRTTRGLSAQPGLAGGGNDRLFERVTRLYRTQILVDEATDFSALQLASMAALADPVADSFAACGDFNQRFTEWGMRTSSDIAWVSSTLDVEEVRVTYRHSRQLNALAHSIARIGDDDHEAAVLPPHVDNEGVSPLLGARLRGDALVTWTAERIREIELLTGALPSLAVFVNSEDEVEPFAEALGGALAQWHIPCTACRSGQVAGYESDVRVFDIQHIKGLEFEGVFFIGVDRLAETYPTLFNKYLYVGATRAAMYLAMTTEGEVPAVLDPMLNMFGVDWANEVRQ